MNLILGLSLAFIVFLMANGLYKIMNRPKIVPIDPAEHPNAALLVIDMQEDFTRAKGKQAHDADRLNKSINMITDAVEKAQGAGIPVIEISHAFTDPIEKFVIKLIAGGAGVEGSAGLKRDEALEFEADHHLWKHEGDSFTNAKLPALLDELKVGHLFLTGQEATACVKSTAYGALKRNYQVTLLDDAILARNEDKWKAMRTTLLAKGAVRGTDIAVS